MAHASDTGRQPKEEFLRAMHALQAISDHTLQVASPILEHPGGLGLLTGSHLHHLARQSRGLCVELDHVGQLLQFQQDRLLRRIPTPGGVRGLHCSLDGTLYLTFDESPCIQILDLSGHSLHSLPCSLPGPGAFVSEDVTVTGSGLVLVSSLVHRAVFAFHHFSKASKGEWVKILTFASPRGLGVDALGRFLVADYASGLVHSFSLSSSFKALGLTTVSGLCGPRYVSNSPDGGFVVSEECGDVRLFGHAHQPLGSLGSRFQHPFGNPAGVCTDAQDNIIVADEQHKEVTLFPPTGAPVRLVSKGLQRPTGVACASHGRLLVADNGDNCVKIFKYQR
ncbi:NHL-repeat-containing protein 4 [Sarcophilus harrisii]|uniref:NHL-repeat-containing protein 4 n=1 Tax=Sarcophilus harrisii TaxID=9305 RepID=UPI000C7CAC14|nr:NHL-repeat-containing protein 4 [Sarcophilus harrisii]